MFDRYILKVARLLTVLTILAAVCAACIVLSSKEVRALPNNNLTFQGKIVHQLDGTNVGTGTPTCVQAGVDTCDFQASIYSDATGGTLVWQERHHDVELGDNNGVFTLNLNTYCDEWENPVSSLSCTGTPVVSGLTWGADESLYLEVAFDPLGADTYSETFTRKLLTSVPSALYATTAGSVQGGLDTVYANDSDKVLDINDILALEFRSSSAGNINFNLTAGGDVVISENGTTFMTFSETNGVIYNPDDATDVFRLSNGNLQVGSTGVPNLALDGLDAYIQGTFEVDGLTDFGSNVDFNNNQALDFRVENADGSITIPTCAASTQGRMYYDISADSAFVCIETAPTVYGWFDFTQTSVQSNKVVTVGTGGDYTTLSAGAAYLNTLGGGIILLTPETHNVTSPVDVENISLIGANTGDTILNLTGNGVLNVKETQFKSMTLTINSGISSVSGLDAKYNSATTSSIIFEWVDFNIGSGKVLIDSSAGTAPTIRTRFISTYTTTGGRKIFRSTATANLDAASTHFVESQGGSGTLDLEDWDVKIAGSANVTTSGTIETIPSDTIYIYPGMNIQAAINSLSSGGVVVLLPGIHNISSTIQVSTGNIHMTGYGDSSILRASGFTGGTQIAAIHVGAPNGAAAVNDVTLSDFKLEVSGTGASDIHGIRVAGGEDNQVKNVTVQKTAGASGSGDGARVGIFFIDGTITRLSRPVVKDCRVLGNSTSGAYFTDGIHVTGGSAYGFAGVWTNGTGVDNALVDGNFVDYVRETVAVFIGITNGSLFNNRFSRMGAGGGGAYGIFMGNSRNINMTANVVSTSLSSASLGIVLENINSGSLKELTDSMFSSNTIDGAANGGVGFNTGIMIGNATNTGFHRNVLTNNIINGASNTVTTAISVTGNADDNIFSTNVINGINNTWDTGISIASATAERNSISHNTFITTTINITDGGTATQLGMAQHNATTSPTVNDDSADGYAIGTIWVNTTTQAAYIATSVTIGAALWEQIDTSGGSADLDTVYTTDADKILNVNNASGLQFLSSVAGNINFDLASTGDFTLQDNGIPFFTLSDIGGLDMTLDGIDNPSFTLNNLGSGAFIINDEAGDTTPFTVDSNGYVGIGQSTPGVQLTVGDDTGINDVSGAGDVYVQNSLEVDGRIFTNDQTVYGDLNLGFTPGAMVFHGSNGLEQDSANLYWNDSTNRMGIGTNAPGYGLEINNPSSSSLGVISSDATGTSSFRVANTSGSNTLQTLIFGDAVGGSMLGVSMADSGFMIANGVNALAYGSQNNVPLYFSTNDTVDMTILDNAVGIGTTSPTNRLDIAQSVSTTSLDGMQINYTQTTNVANLLGSAFEIQATSSGDAGDTIRGINIADLTSTASAEFGLNFGTGWDRDLNFNNTNSTWGFADNTALSWTDGTNNLLLATDLSTNFGMALEAGAFVSRNAYVGEEFSRERANITADGNQVWGDFQQWGVDENTTCTFSIVDDTINGIGRLETSAAGGNSCLAYHSAAAGNAHLQFNATNLPVILMKVRPSSASATDDTWVGIGTDAAGSATEPASGIYFTNNNTANWYGVTRSGGTSVPIACGVAISTSQFALLKIEVRSITEVRFFIDPDTSNGVNWTSCGTSITNIPAVNLTSMLKRYSAANNASLDIDFYRVWQDDTVDTGGIVLSSDTLLEETTDVLGANDSALDVSQESIESRVNLLEEQLNNALILLNPGNESILDISALLSDIETLQIKNLEILLDLNILGDLTAQGALEIQGDATFNGHVTFNNDTVGQAQILKGDKKVHILFAKEYKFRPIVTASIEGKVSVNDFYITGVTTKGFNIEIDAVNKENVTFNWHAFGISKPSLIDSTGIMREMRSIQVLDGQTEVFADPLSLPECSDYQWIRGFSEEHNGVDLATGASCPIAAIGDGKTVFAGWLGEKSGYSVVIDHGNEIYSYYIHGSGTFYVETDEVVSRGDPIMDMGSSGESTGLHLHLGLMDGNEFLDPALYVDFKNIEENILISEVDETLVSIEEDIEDSIDLTVDDSTDVPVVEVTDQTSDIPSGSEPSIEEVAETGTLTVILTDNEQLSIFESRSANSSILGNIPLNTVVEYLNKKEDWYEITYEGVTGWIDGNYVIVNL